MANPEAAKAPVLDIRERELGKRQSHLVNLPCSTSTVPEAAVVEARTQAIQQSMAEETEEAMGRVEEALKRILLLEEQAAQKEEAQAEKGTEANQALRQPFMDQEEAEAELIGAKQVLIIDLQAARATRA